MTEEDLNACLLETERTTREDERVIASNSLQFITTNIKVEYVTSQNKQPNSERTERIHTTEFSEAFISSAYTSSSENFHGHNNNSERMLREIDADIGIRERDSLVNSSITITPSYNSKGPIDDIYSKSKSKRDLMRTYPKQTVKGDINQWREDIAKSLGKCKQNVGAELVLTKRNRKDKHRTTDDHKPKKRKMKYDPDDDSDEDDKNLNQEELIQKYYG